MTNALEPSSFSVAEIAARPVTVIIAGVHKAGTTSLFEYLAAHPGISPAHIKELRHFSRLARDGTGFDAGEYDRLFHYREKACYRLEASPAYLCAGPHVAELVKSALPGAKIIVLLREPVERLLSLYNRAVAHSDLPQDFSFHEYVLASLEWQPGDSAHYVYTQGLREGFYIEHLPTWDALFGEELKVLFTDDLKADGKALTADVCHWLGLEASCLAAEPFDISNRTLHYRFRRIHRHITRWYMQTETYWRRHPALKRAIRRVYNRINGGRAALPAVRPQTLDLLRDVYAPYNDRLREFLIERGVSLPSWLQSHAECRATTTGARIATSDVKNAGA